MISETRHFSVPCSKKKHNLLCLSMMNVQQILLSPTESTPKKRNYQLLLVTKAK